MVEQYPIFQVSTTILFEAFSHCLTIIFNQFNESWYPVRPLGGWSVLNRPWFTNQKIFAGGFRHYSANITQNCASVNMLALSSYGQV